MNYNSREVLKLKVEAFFLILLNLFALCVMFMASLSAIGRGPHHPRELIDNFHHHYRPRGSDSLTADYELLRDARHIEEDSPSLTPEILAKMSPEELEFYYFSAHDFDRNSKLDGLELLKAVSHTIDHEAENPENESSIEPEVGNDLGNFIALVDNTLDSDDTNGDGYVTYPEYRAARLKNPSGRTPRVLAANTP